MKEGAKNAKQEPMDHHHTQYSQSALEFALFVTDSLELKLADSKQSEEPKKNSVGIFEYILASMLKVFLDM